MFKDKEYVALLNNIMEVEMISKYEIANLIGVSHTVMYRLLKPDNPTEPSLIVKRKIKAFIDQYNKDHHE